MPEPSAPPIVFYRSIRTCRNLRTSVSLVVGLLMAANFVNATVRTLGDSHTASPLKLLFNLSAFFFCWVSFQLAKKIVLNIKDLVEITDQGIRAATVQLDWPQVSRILPIRGSFSQNVRIKIAT